MDYPGFVHVKNALIKLLDVSPNVPFSEECRNEIVNGRLKEWEWDRPVELVRLKAIYARRAERAKKQSQPIYGFDELLSNFEQANTGSALIHSVEGKRYN